MKILMLTPYLPYPPSSGGQVRSYNLIKHLSKKHDITLFSLIKKGEEKYQVELSKYCKKVKVFQRPQNPWQLSRILRTGFSSYPFVVIRNLSQELRQAVTEELKNETYDIIHAETFYVMPHIVDTHVPIVLVDQTIEFQVYQHYVQSSQKWYLKPLLAIDVLKIKYWELKFWNNADQAVSVSQDDKRKMQQLVPGLKVEVVPNGAGEDLMNVWGKRTPEKHPVIFFQASFNWMQNIEAAENLAKHVFPLVNKQYPSSECWIVGQAAKEKVGHLQGNGIKVVDLQNNDISGVIDAYKKATIFVAPLEGPGGTRLKVLAAMAAGIPVVITKVGIEGIDAENGKDVLVADGWQQMAKETIRLINDTQLSESLVRNARKLVEEKYSYASIADKLDKIYQKVAHTK